MPDVPADSGIITTAIATVGLVVAAGITAWRKRETAPSLPPPVQVPLSVHPDDARQNERLAVLEFQMEDVDERLDDLERRRRTRRSPPR